MDHLPFSDHLSRLASGGGRGWAVVGVLGAYILVASGGSDVPIGPGVAYWTAWISVAAAGVLVASLASRRLRPTRPWLRPVEVAAILAVAAMVLTDLTMTYQPLRDLGIYLKAGHHFLAGTPVYLQARDDRAPGGPDQLPVPLSAPDAAALRALSPCFRSHWPRRIWVSGSLALGLLALRVIGLPSAGSSSSPSGRRSSRVCGSATSPSRRWRSSLWDRGSGRAGCGGDLQVVYGPRGPVARPRASLVELTPEAPLSGSWRS